MFYIGLNFVFFNISPFYLIYVSENQGLKVLEYRKNKGYLIDYKVDMLYFFENYPVFQGIKIVFREKPNSTNYSMFDFCINRFNNCKYKMNIHKISIVDGNNFHALGIKHVLMQLEACHGAEIRLYHNGTDFLQDDHEPEIVLMNMMLPDIGGIKLCHLSKVKHPDSKIILMSMTDDEESLQSCLSSRANGYLVKDFDETELNFALYKVCNGAYYIDSTIALRLIKNSGSVKRSESSSLNDFELTLLQYISDQMTDMDIVDRLKMPRGKLSYYKRKLYRKLDVKNSAGLIKKAVSLKLVS